MHRLVQAVTRDQLTAKQAAAWITRALALITAVFPKEPEDHLPQARWSLVRQQSLSL